MAWRTFLRAHWPALVTADFFTTEVLTARGLVTYYTAFVIELQGIGNALIDRQPAQPATGPIRCRHRVGGFSVTTIAQPRRTGSTEFWDSTRFPKHASAMPRGVNSSVHDESKHRQVVWCDMSLLWGRTWITHVACAEPRRERTWCRCSVWRRMTGEITFFVFLPPSL
jgi:hypothetical protein